MNNEFNKQNNNIGTNLTNNNTNQQLNSQYNMGMNSNMVNNFQQQSQMNNGSVNPNNAAYSNQQMGYNSNINSNYNQSNFNQQPTQIFNPANQMKPNKGSNKKIVFLIIGIAVLAVACVLLTILLLTGNKENNSNQNINEYEEGENTTNNVTNTETQNTTNNSSVYTYSGFEFKKVSGYQYSEMDGILIVQSSNYVVSLEVAEESFNTIKNNEALYNSKFKSQMESLGYTTNNFGIQTVSGNEVYTGEISDGTNNGLLFIIKADETHVYTGSVLNSSNTLGADNINEVLKVVNGATYVGGYDSYSKGFDFSKSLDITE